MTKGSRIALLFIIAMSVLGVFFFVLNLGRSRTELPVLGEPGHTAGKFSFVNQFGQTVTEKDISNKITVVEYFFTTCPGICKQMAEGLKEVYQQYGEDPHFIILSHTVDPHNDTVAALKAYADKLEVHNNSWHFLTGDKQALYDIARKDYLLSVEDSVGVGIDEDFIHTQYVCLLDTDRRIRGFYDATNKQSVEKLIKDIATLLPKKGTP